MNSRYVIYDGRPNMRAVGPQVSISKEGRLSLNKVASAIFDKEAVERVLLGWDAQTNHIALHKIIKKDARARVVRYGKDGRGAAFNAKDFLESFVGYDLSSRGRAFLAEWNADEATLEFAIEPAHLTRAKKTSGGIGINGKKMQQG
jgi:hypothetical protein